MKLNWRQGALYTTIIVMEGCVLYVLFTLLNKQVADERLSVFGLLLLYPVAFGFNKLLQRLKLPGIFNYTANGLAWAISMLLMIKAQLFSYLALSDPAWLLALPRAIADILYAFEPELLILLGSALLWWLGRRLARIQTNFTTTTTEFQFGLVIILITFFVATQLNAEMADAVPITLVFSFSALLGISIAHSQEGAGWLSGLYQGHWAGLLLVSISLILILGLLVGSIITPDLLQLILDALKWIWSQIMKVVAFLMNLFPEPGPAEPLPAMPAPPPTEPSEGFDMSNIIPESVRSGLRLVWTILMVGFLLVFLWRVSSQIFRWLRHKLSTTAGAEIEPLRGAFRADILGLLKRILLKLLGFKLPLRRQRQPEPPEITSVRHLYHRLLQWAAAQGRPKSVFQTPFEYLAVLEELLPASRNNLHFITRLYVSARYGLSSPSTEELHQLKQSWHQVKQTRIKHQESGD